jgi:glycosyltransferase involved in cell wall biosynthesis
MFIDALARQADRVRIIRIVPEELRASWAERPQVLDALESEFWGHTVNVSLIARRRRGENFYNHYVQGIFSSSERPEFYAYGGVKIWSEVQKHLEQPTSAVFLHRLQSAYAFPGHHPIGNTRIYFDLDDVEHRVLFRKIVQPPFWIGKCAYGLHIPAIINAERRTSRRSRATLVCSAIDQKHLERLSFSNVAVVPNAVRTPPARQPLTSSPNILFLGLIEYAPNREAVTRLAKSILPKIWQQLPVTKLIIAGQGSETLEFDDSDGRIEKLGFVADLDALYARARLVCCPLRNGGGTRIKLIEAAAYSKPVVTTTVGNEGLDFEDGSEVLVRDDDEDIARACVDLLSDTRLCERLAENAHRRMNSHYERSMIVNRIAGIVNG